MKTIQQVAKAIKRDYPNSVKNKQFTVKIESDTTLRVWLAIAWDDRGWEFLAEEIEWMLRDDGGIKSHKIVVNVVEDRYADPDYQGIEVEVEFYGKH